MKFLFFAIVSAAFALAALSSTARADDTFDTYCGSSIPPNDVTSICVTSFDGPVLKSDPSGTAELLVNPAISQRESFLSFSF